MENLLIVLLGFIKILGFFGLGSLLVLASLLLIQLISYRVFNFNLYKIIKNKLFKGVR